MASEKSFVDFITDQVDTAGIVTNRKMFGEYALYCNEKVVAFVCDNKLFIKPTQAGRDFIKDPVEAPPYPGGKLWFLIEDRLEDRDWLTEIIRITAKELPVPAPKKPRKNTAKK